MTAIELIQETVDYYSADPSRRATQSGACKYLTRDGRMCAVGRCLIEEENDGLCMSAKLLSRRCGRIPLETILKEKYRGFPIDLWMDIQKFHDEGVFWTKEGISDMGDDFVAILLKKWK